MDEIIAQKNAQYWAEYWHQVTSVDTKRGPMQATFWDSMSSRFAKNRSPEKEEERFQAVLTLINTTGLDLKGAEVLDIGAGTGSLSIPLAKMGANVTALDFSKEMLKNLKDRADDEKVSISRIINKSWDEIDLDTEGFRGTFDLVIASMTPAVRDPQTFDMMMQASRQVCYYSGWVNRRWDKAYYDLHRMLFNTEYQQGTHGIYLPYMYLCFLGYNPEIHINKDSWKSETTIDEMVHIIASHFSGSTDIDSSSKAKIREYLNLNGNDGRYSEESVTTSAMMVWDKLKK